MIHLLLHSVMNYRGSWSKIYHLLLRNLLRNLNVQLYTLQQLFNGKNDAKSFINYPTVIVSSALVHECMQHTFKTFAISSHHARARRTCFESCTQGVSGFVDDAQAFSWQWHCRKKITSTDTRKQEAQLK